MRSHTMALFATKQKSPISSAARSKRQALQPYPTIETWRNPLTRGIARHFANEAWAKTLKEIDFEYRLTDREIGGVPCVDYETPRTGDDDGVIIYVHGGGFVAGSARTNAAMALPTCNLSGRRGVGVEYTLLPDKHFPAQIDEITSVYQALCETFPPEKIAIFGDSAGGCLALSCLQKWRREGSALPGHAILVSPVADGLGASDTHRTLDGADPLIQAQGGKIFRKLFDFYAPGKDLSDPAISPVYGDMYGLPRLLVHVGSREVALGDAARICEAARLAGVDQALRVFDGMYHLFHMNWSLEEAKIAHRDIADFLKTD